MGYNSVADSTCTYLHSFSRYWFAIRISVKSREILREFELIVGQGHRSWCQSNAHM